MMLTIQTEGRIFINGKEYIQDFLISGASVSGTLQPSYTNIVFNKGGIGGIEGFDLAYLAKINNWKEKGSKVPKDMYFVMGDNRSQSVDSRTFGYVPKDKVLGRVFIDPTQPGVDWDNKVNR